ncbi:hypothetical protein ACFGVS_00485 [Mucilaginibacter sp. AW1-7]|uniref:hypothetical protein n=1 Tax=Mucilaginibacter sp. AW1-7 TaxID=3349874 RepID=UPI003F73B2AF
MTRVEQQALSAELDRAITVGNPWVVFNDQPDKILQPQDLRFFSSAGAAEKFCDAANGEFDFAEQMFHSDNYRYMQAATLKASLEMDVEKNIKMDITAVARQMAEQNLSLLPGTSYDVFESALSRGQLLPVSWQRTIDPLKEIEEYHVIAHQHSGGMIYEIGHSHRVLESFGSSGEARSFMDSVVFYNELADKGTDYLIVGRFPGQSLELDVEGYAVPHSGLTLVTAHHNYENGHDYHELQPLSEPATVSRYFFMGVRDGGLLLFNDKLEPTTLDVVQQPFYPTHFINDYLPFKNSIIMNEQSFDYVKNQLFYLGFGEEVAKPLREKMEQNLTEFSIPHSRKFGQDETNSILHFSKGDQKDKDMTFFNRADITLKQPGKEDLTQTFFFGKEYNYTLQERYNMMDGRAAYREQPKMAPVEENGEVRMKPTGETYFAWRGLDFKNADQYGNFNPKVTFWNHQKEVGKYPIKGIEENYDKLRLIAKLEKGNKVDVVLLRDGHETQAKLVANPRMARLDFYDSTGQSLIVRKVEKQAVDQRQKVEMTPQEVQRAAIASHSAQKPGQSTGQNQSNAAAVSGTEAQHHSSGQDTTQKSDAKQQVAAEEQNQQGQRRKQGVRV